MTDKKYKECLACTWYMDEPYSFVCQICFRTRPDKFIPRKDNAKIIKEAEEECIR